MVGARLVPPSPFRGPSKTVGITLALYDGNPRVYVFARIRVWRQNRRGETWPDFPNGSVSRVRCPLLALLNAGAPGGFFAAQKIPNAFFCLLRPFLLSMRKEKVALIFGRSPVQSWIRSLPERRHHRHRHDRP